MSEDDVVAKACLEKLLVGQESDERKVQLVERISQSPYWSNQAGHLLDDQTFSQADEVLAKSVAQDPSL